MKIKIYITIIMPVVLYGCETWSLTLREELRLSVFENTVLRKILVQRTMREQENGEDYVTRSSVFCTSHQILFR
jgi:hypothetical protein